MGEVEVEAMVEAMEQVVVDEVVAVGVRRWTVHEPGERRQWR
jgi:hypothetical protein